MLEAEEATRHGRNRVVVVVDALEVRNLGVEERGKFGRADAGGAVGDSSDADGRREGQRHHERVELGDGSAEGVSDLRT
jgi:hypothetical protein